MGIQLKNDYLHVRLQKPGEIYQGSRFDWTGQIVQIRFLDKYNFGSTETKDPAQLNILGRGLYNEFGIDQPVGYNECAVGKEFLKIGIGSLIKESDKPYDFFHAYRINPGEFNVAVDSDKAVFTFHSDPDLDHACQLRKEIVLNMSTIAIHYHLINVGKKPLVTNEYVHNFIAINDRLVGPQYQLYLPFPVSPDQCSKVVNPDSVLQFKNSTISWSSTPQSDFFCSDLQDGFTCQPGWTLVHLHDKVGIQEKTDFTRCKINLWGRSHVISPEIYKSISVGPEQSMKWGRFYTFFTLGLGGNDKIDPDIP